MADARRPNILFILADDLGWADLSCYGSTFYETPNLDRLAAQGTRFTDAYAACPVCSPTRASLLTGKYPATVGITNWIPGNPWGELMGVPFFDELPAGEATLADALGEAGYVTCHVGKWHLGGPDRYPDRCGFDVNVGGCDWGGPWGPGGYFTPYGLDTLDDGPEGEYLTDRLTDEAIRLIEAAGERPWFLNLWHYAVHTPMQAPRHLVEKYEKKAADLGLDPAGPLVPGEAMPVLHKRGERVMRRTVQSHPVYAAMIENLDANVGRLLAALARLGRADDTLVIFSSDNGGLSTAEGSPTCNAPLCEGKGWMYEGGVREPMIARWPGVVPAGRVSGDVLTSPDLYPTLLDAAGLPPRPGQHVDGVSAMPALRGEAHDRGPVFWHFPHYSNQGGEPACSVREGRWKLIEFFRPAPEPSRLELYDLHADVGETRDLSAHEPAVRDRLHGLLRGWRERVGARIPRKNERYAAMLAGDEPSPDGCGRFPVPGDDHGGDGLADIRNALKRPH